MDFKDIPQFTTDGNYRVDVSLGYLKEAIDIYLEEDECHKLNMNPDFQRGHVWNIQKQIKFVEFLLKGGTSAKIIYFNHPGWMRSFKGEFVLVDGKQRLEAALKFLDNKLPIFDGNYYKDFTGRFPLSARLTFCVNDLKTRAEVLQWYLDLNTGGVVHTDDEIERVRNLLNEEKAKNK